MYVFYRLDRDPKLTYLFSSYEETANTKAIEWQGKTVCGLFLNTDSGAMVARIHGWKEITDEWNKEDENEDQAQAVVNESQEAGSTPIVEKVVKPKTKRKRTTKSK